MMQVHRIEDKIHTSRPKLTTSHPFFKTYHRYFFKMDSSKYENAIKTHYVSKMENTQSTQNLTFNIHRQKSPTRTATMRRLRLSTLLSTHSKRTKTKSNSKSSWHSTEAATLNPERSVTLSKNFANKRGHSLMRKRRCVLDSTL